ncbi:MAG: TRAP transporter substrate-binding protein [Alphaproteobacteria bacterium]|nr:TRAP transporter substrate-binding protein [Alphaproteobacteria bacterium]
MFAKLKKSHSPARNALVGAVAAVAMLAGAVTGAEAAGKPMTISVIYGPDKPQAKVWLRFKQLVDARLPGQFDIKVVTNGALGGEKETTEGIRLGSIHGALSTVANLTTWVPEGALFDMPFVFRDADQIKAVMSGPIGAAYKKKYEAQGFKVLGYITYGARHVISKDPIRTPADVKGKKMRVLQSQLHIDLWQSLGANPTPVPITEAYNALGTGVVDYMDMTKSGYEALKLYEVVPSFTETGHIWALGVMYVGNKYWDGLTAEQQAVFQQTADQVIPFFNEMAAYEQSLALDRTVEKGVKVIRPDKAPWQKAMAPFWKSYADKVGGMAMIDQIVATK